MSREEGRGKSRSARWKLVEVRTGRAGGEACEGGGDGGGVLCRSECALSFKIRNAGVGRAHLGSELQPIVTGLRIPPLLHDSGGCCLLHMFPKRLTIRSSSPYPLLGNLFSERLAVRLPRLGEEDGDELGVDGGNGALLERRSVALGEGRRRVWWGALGVPRLMLMLSASAAGGSARPTRRCRRPCRGKGVEFVLRCFETALVPEPSSVVSDGRVDVGVQGDERELEG